jgi:hypothetical protein
MIPIVSAQSGRWLQAMPPAILIAAAAVSIGVFMSRLRRRALQRRCTIETEQCRDNALDHTFPASDPPATQYFDIPVNRRGD